jgi:hypothetical protein
MTDINQAIARALAGTAEQAKATHGVYSAGHLTDIGYGWFSAHAPWIMPAGDAVPFRFQQLCVALGMFLAELDDLEPAPGTAPDACDQVPAAEQRLQAVQPLLIDGSPLDVSQDVHYVSYGTPGGEYGQECLAAIITEVGRVEVNERNPAGDGIYRDALGLFVMYPNGTSHKTGVLGDPGTYTAGPRTSTPGEPLPVIRCADLTFAGGTWHRPGL